METTGYVLRICPFEDVAMVGLAAEDVDSFLQVNLTQDSFEIRKRISSWWSQ